MRIIAGEHGGRRIEAPPGGGTRPMLDRVRESLFATLGERVVDASVLDLCAGSGGLGLEALSRGAARARLVERDRAVLRVLRANVGALGVAERTEVVAGDALARSSWAGEAAPYDLVFFDPPYALVDAARAAVLAAVERLLVEFVARHGVLVFHTPRGKLHELQFARVADAELREYGTNALWYLTPRGERT